MHRLLVLVLVAATSALAAAQSPYVGDLSRSIKALSSDEVSDYLAGKGMGLAKPAELNGYPGPAHVLELADRLELSPPQRVATQAVFARMQTEARAIGERLVAEEQALDASFAHRSVTQEQLRTATASIAALQGRLRDVHLRAHLLQADILSREQAERYAELRGYAAAAPLHRHGH